MAGTTDFEGFYCLKQHEAVRGRTDFADEDEEDSGFFSFPEDMGQSLKDSGRSTEAKESK